MMAAGPPMPATVLKSKICLVGEQGVGKTSLVLRFVHGVFDESYLRTLGAVAYKKTVDLESVRGRAVRVDLSILDIMGNRTFLQLFQEAYFHGVGGILAVADLTRRPTLAALVDWIKGVESVGGQRPTVLVLNKADLAGAAELDASGIDEVARRLGSSHFRTSAKTGANVEEAFRRLAFLVADRQLSLP